MRQEGTRVYLFDNTSSHRKSSVGESGRDRRGIALAIVLCAQLMIVLDMTVVNIALPSIARGLHFSAANLSWVLNAYALTFGGLLLLGGRAGDILGRRRVFMAGVALFTGASLAGGLATTGPWLLAARAVQGVGGAIASPAVLAMIISNFPGERERTRALGIFTAVAMGGASLGLVLGGVITEWVSWRWVLFINVPIGLAVLASAPRILAESPRQPGRFDITGALASTAGMSGLVYAFIRAASSGWGDRLTQGAFAVAVILLVCFVVNESRSPHPITPLHLFADAGRAGSYVARLLLVAGMFGMFFFLTQFVQEVLGFSPLQAGFAFVPMTGALFAVSRSASRLIPRFGGQAADGGRAGSRGYRHVLARAHLAGDELPARNPRPDAAARGRNGADLRATDGRLTAQRATGGLRCCRQHG